MRKDIAGLSTNAQDVLRQRPTSGAVSSFKGRHGDRIGQFYEIERDIKGQPSDAQHKARQKLSQPKVAVFFDWSEQQLLRIPGKSALAKAFRYGLSRWAAFSLFLTDGRVAFDNNPVERALRPTEIGRRARWQWSGYFWLRALIRLFPKPATRIIFVFKAEVTHLRLCNKRR